MERPFVLTRHEPEQRKVRGQHAPPASSNKKSVPQEKTFAEEFYYRKQMQNRTRMVIRLTSGEELRGWIEWYDRDALKVNRDKDPNLLINKRYVLYMYKADEEGNGRGDES